VAVLASVLARVPRVATISVRPVRKVAVISKAVRITVGKVVATTPVVPAALVSMAMTTGPAASAIKLRTTVAALARTPVRPARAKARRVVKVVTHPAVVARATEH
jgi:hypothetical protein